jgi:hypothetical protein
MRVGMYIYIHIWLSYISIYNIYMYLSIYIICIYIMYIYIWNIGEIINSDTFWLFSLRLGGGWTRGTAHTIQNSTCASLTSLLQQQVVPWSLVKCLKPKKITIWIGFLLND